MRLHVDVTLLRILNQKFMQIFRRTSSMTIDGNYLQVFLESLENEITRDCDVNEDKNQNFYH